jgi:ATP synthase subunit 6
MMFFSRTEQFQLISVFPIVKDSVDLSITNRLVYLRRTARLVRHLRFKYMQKENTLVPRTGTLVFESITSFIQGMTEDQVGKAKGRTFVPLVLTVFLLILGRNRMGMIPQTFPFLLRTVTYLRRVQLSQRRSAYAPGLFSNDSFRVKASAKRIPRRDSSSYVGKAQNLLSSRRRTFLRRLRWRQMERISRFGNSQRRKGSRSSWIRSTTELPTGEIVPRSTSETFLAKMVSPRAGRSVRAKKRNRKRWTLRRLQRRIFVGALRTFSSAPRRFTPTSHLAFTFRISRSLFLGLIFYSLELHGFHFFSFFFPRGIPFALAPFIVVLEMISFFFRPVSLGVRLRANMTAGHLLLHTVRGFVSALLGMKGVAFCLLGRRGRVVLEGVFLLETGVCFLQAYVFTALFTIYLKDADALH